MKAIATLILALLMSASFASGEARELVIFPFAQGAAVQPTEDFNVDVEALNALYAQMKELPNLYVLRFRETNPSVRRAIEENRIRRDRVAPPFNEREADGTWRAARVGELMGVDLAFAGRIEEFSFDSNTREAIVTLSGNLIDVKTGEVLLSVAETGRGRLGTEDNDPNIARIAAVAQAAEKVGAAVRTRLAPPTEQPATEPQQKERPDRRSERTVATLFTLILGVILGTSQF
ncbi:MAG: hypothetical protein KatS3mg017_0809 [Fimbriimonadales bacterium]|nr:MAG: hypothetical protein KatS3mg017_0809 [Fimbriimonadales bacterium]GIV10425.1 MAG: hypothetical protein KatS3mg019_2516 [Fimbriimonadales bacterium]